MGRLLAGYRFGDQAIQHARWDAQIARVGGGDRSIEDLRCSQPSYRRDGDEWREIKERGLAAKLPLNLVKGEAILLNEVPLVQHQHETLACIDHRAGDV